MRACPKLYCCSAGGRHCGARVLEYFHIHSGAALLVPSPASAAASFEQTLYNYHEHVFKKIDILLSYVYFVSALEVFQQRFCLFQDKLYCCSAGGRHCGAITGYRRQQFR